MKVLHYFSIYLLHYLTFNNMILLIFDLETTGVDKKKDQIIQFAGLKIDTETNKIVEELNQYIQPTGNYTISLAAYFKHRITPEFLAKYPHMEEVAPVIYKFFNGVDNVLTYNGNGFDIPFLKIELNKYGFDIDFTKKNCYDAFLEEKRRNGNSLENTYVRYRGKSMEEAGLTAHDAFSDIKATYSVFVAQQRKEGYGPEHLYGEDGAIQDMIFLDEIQPCFNIGKYRGISIDYVAEHDQGYLQWCVSDKCNFINSTKEFIKQYLK